MRQANTVHHYRIPAVLALITVAVMLAFAAVMTVSAQSNDPDWRQAPTGLSVTTGNEAGKLDINWDTSSQDTKTLSDYRVTWKPDGEAFKHWGETDWNAFPSTNELTLTGLNAGETYQVKVRARYDDNTARSQLERRRNRTERRYSERCRHRSTHYQRNRPGTSDSHRRNVEHC